MLWECLRVCLVWVLGRTSADGPVSGQRGEGDRDNVVACCHLLQLPYMVIFMGLHFVWVWTTS